MTFDELLVEDRIAAIERLQSRRLELVEQAQAADRGALRRTLARGLVRLGAWLDRGAVERAPVTRRAH
jgi:hypothetical protein